MQHTPSCCSSCSGKHQDSLPKSMMASARVSYTAWGRRLGRGRLRRGRLGRRGGGTQAVQHRHRRHLLVSLAACSLAFTAASASALSRALRLGRHPRAMNPPPPAAQLRPTPCSSDAWRIAPGRPLACFFAVTCDSSEALHAPRDTGCSVVHDVVEWLRSLSPRPNRGPLPALDIGPMRFNSVYSVMGRVTTGGRPPRRRARGGKHTAPRHDCPGRTRPGRGGAPDTRHRRSDTGAKRPA